MNRGEAAHEIRRRALSAGFDLAGVAALGPSATGAALERWLAAGHQAGMSYLERYVAERLDPRRLLPGAKSILCVAMSYAPDPQSPPDPFWSGVARYAHGEDYHDAFRQRIAHLAAALEGDFPGLRWRVAVDTAPLLEREWAARAGLGAVGKNGCLIHPELGSWLLLGSLVTNLDLEPDLPLADLCGDCSRCLAACPTDAFPAPFVLDSRRCISYWTIEHRGPIASEMRPLLGEWVFGCDRCQEVCPWNRDAPPGRQPAPAAGDDRRRLSLMELLQLPDPELRRRIRGSALRRAKPDGLRRNAAVGLGNRGSQAATGVLAEALGHPSPVVRQHAAWALGRIGGAASQRALQSAIGSEADPEVRAEIAAALGGATPSFDTL